MIVKACKKCEREGNDENNHCLECKAGHDYIYDNEIKTFKLAGEVNSVEVTGGVNGNASFVIPNLKEKYTCKNTSKDATCSTLYYVYEYNNSTNAYVISLNGNSNYSQFGTLAFNNSNTSLADIGYMYNKRYSFTAYNINTTETMLSSASLSENYWYSDSINWGSPKSNAYNLVNPFKGTNTEIVSNYPNDLVGKYTFRNENENYTSSSVYYVVAINGTTMYYIQLYSNYHNLSYYDDKYTFGDNYIDNGDNTYTIINSDDSPVETIYRHDWYNRIQDLRTKRYICKNVVNNTCSEPRYIITFMSTSMQYVKPTNNIKYAKSFKYKLDSSDGQYKYYLDDNDFVNYLN